MRKCNIDMWIILLHYGKTVQWNLVICLELEIRVVHHEKESPPALHKLPPRHGKLGW